MKLEQWVNSNGDLIAQCYKLTLKEKCEMLLLNILAKRNGQPWKHWSDPKVVLTNGQPIGGLARVGYSKPSPAKKQGARSKTKIAKLAGASLTSASATAPRNWPGTSTAAMAGTKFYTDSDGEDRKIWK